MNFTYTTIMIAAVVTGVVLGRHRQRSMSLGTAERLGIGIGGFCGAMLGAKLPFVLSDWQGFLSGAAWFADGKTILCGLAGGYFGVELAKWSLEIKTKTGDSFAVPVAASVAVGRLACFYGGCCYGTHTTLPWGIVFPAVDTLPRHPTQLYEAAFHATAAIVLEVLYRRQLLRGQLIKLYILAYLGYRFLTEIIRPEARLWGGLTGYQWGALLLTGVFVWLWMRDAHRFAAQKAMLPASND